MIPLWDGARRTAGKASERVLKEGVRWLGYVTKHIGDVPLKDITPQMVEATYAAIREERGLSGTSMNHIHQLLKSVFQKAIDYDFIYKNPCAHVVAPRRGEVFALSWENVDLERRTVRVCQSITYQRQIKTPKTQAGIRTLAIDATTAPHLATRKERQASELAKIGVKQTGKTPVCCSDTGSWYRIDTFDNWWRAWRKEHGFDGLKFHELRHTQATQLLANGVDVKTVQTRLGHANASITLGWYAHAIPEKDHEAANLLGAILSGAKPQDNAAEEEEKFPEMSPETESSRMSPECPLDAHGPEKRKQASRLKKAS